MSVHSETSSATEDGPEISDAETSLSLVDLPPIFVLSTHLDTDSLHEIEDQILHCEGLLTYDPGEARIFVGKVAHKLRAILELRSIGVHTSELAIKKQDNLDGPARKVRRVDRDGHGQDTSKEKALPTKEQQQDDASQNSAQPSGRIEAATGLPDNQIVVVTLAWLETSIAKGQPQDLSEHLVYKGERSTDSALKKDATSKSPDAASATPTSTDILARARADLSPKHQQPAKAFASHSQTNPNKHPRRAPARTATLVRQTTDEMEAAASTHELPELPDWAKRGSTFSCERSTPANGPNQAFVEALKKIRLARTLTLDEIGVRAYSTSIAAIAAYPHPITDSREILRLPGCDTKIAALWVEWQSKGGFVQAAHDAEHDPEMRALRLFYDIWGVGAQTARNFYNRGWRDLDDVVEFGWDELSRVQQIGVKFFDQFQMGISRQEVESIASTIHAYAQRVREPTGVRSIIVGGHRRGKVESGDVDVIISHTDENETVNIVQDVVASLMEDGWVTDQLLSTLQSSRRGQAVLPFRRDGGGHGFDNLDKALVVWQDPEYDEVDAPEGKNPNVHRRVDIIVAPWSRIGCAVLGWSAETTFQRDVRRYVKHKFKWKFDSSGIRSRVTGQEIDLEGVGGPCKTAEEAERKVFAGMGLEYKEPWERCTG